MNYEATNTTACTYYLSTSQSLSVTKSVCKQYAKIERKITTMENLTKMLAG